MHTAVGKKHTFLGCLATSGYNESALKELSCIRMCTSTVEGKSLVTPAEWKCLLLLLKVSQRLTPCVNKMCKVQPVERKHWDRWETIVVLAVLRKHFCTFATKWICGRYFRGIKCMQSRLYLKNLWDSLQQTRHPRQLWSPLSVYL